MFFNLIHLCTEILLVITCFEVQLTIEHKYFLNKPILLSKLNFLVDICKMFILSTKISPIKTQTLITVSLFELYICL